MAQHPFLKSIKPVNLLSFGPNTEEIELRPLNILIGPNGCGKSNLIEILRLVWLLPEKEPWSVVLETGGVDEWVWKGTKERKLQSSLLTRFSMGDANVGLPASAPKTFGYSISLDKFDSSFRVGTESIERIEGDGTRDLRFSWFERVGSQGEIHQRSGFSDAGPIRFDLNLDRSVLSQLTAPSLQATGAGQALPEMFEVAKFFDSFDFHQDWEFGADLTPRDPVPVGQPVDRLEEYEPFESLDVRLIGTHLQAAINEEGGFSVSAYRLSDGTLRWLALLTILLNPTPAPVICIEEPELGLHPDVIHVLADLLREASTRTQLIVTTHSTALVDAFSDDPEAVCVCEKVDGATVIKRLEKERMKVWLDDYSLGHLWASGEIGGNRW